VKTPFYFSLQITSVSFHPQSSTATPSEASVTEFVYAAYAPFIRHWDINRLPYNGEADRWFDPAWLVAGGHRP
jgi:hypothetical protein